MSTSTTITATATSTMTLDTDALGRLYLPFEPSNTANGWNWNDGKTAYFLSQGSEYQLDLPSVSQSQEVPSPDMVKNIEAFTAFLVEMIGSNPANQSLVAELKTWASGIAAGGTADLMTVTTTATHIRNTAGDDTAACTFTFVYCPPLDRALLLEYVYNIDWAGTLAGTGNIVMGFAKSVHDSLDVYKKVVEIFGATIEIAGCEALSFVALACTVALTLGKFFLSESDDGGRANFLAVLAHALIRTASCAAPRSEPASQVPCLNTDALGPVWSRTIKQSTPTGSNLQFAYLSGLAFGQDMPATYTYGGNTQTTVYNQPYRVWMPELSWGLGAIPFVFATSKIYSNSNALTLWPYGGEELYTIGMLFYGPSGNAVSSATQLASASNADIIVCDWFGSKSHSAINQSFDGTYQDNIAETGAMTVQSNQLTFVVPQTLNSIVSSMSQQATPAQPAINSGVTWYTAARYDTGDAPAVAVRPDGSVVEVHDSRFGNISQLYWNYGTLASGSSSVSWNKTDGGTKFETGTWPALSTNPGSSQDILEIHNDSGDIKWMSGSVSTSGKSVDFGDNATQMCGGDHPSVQVQSDNITVVMWLSGAMTGLSYLTGIFSSGNLGCYQGNSNDPFVATSYDDDGDYPAILRTGNTILEVHNANQQLWFNLGTLSNDYKTITWQKGGPFPLGQGGSHPHLAYLGSGHIALTYDNDGYLYAGTAKIEGNGTIQWFTTNQPVSITQKGQYPGLSSVPSAANTVLMVFNDTSGNLYSQVGTATFPD